MTTSLQQGGWFRLAFAAVALALLVTMVPQERPGSLRASACITLSPASVSSSSSARWVSWDWPALTHATSADHGALMAILPVLFVGLLAPLVLLFVIATRTPRPLPVSGLASLYQRPPPVQTL